MTENLILKLSNIQRPFQIAHDTSIGSFVVSLN